MFLNQLSKSPSQECHRLRKWAHYNIYYLLTITHIDMNCMLYTDNLKLCSNIFQRSDFQPLQAMAACLKGPKGRGTSAEYVSQYLCFILV